MIIQSAKFRGLHGHLKINLNFKPGVNILIGVNGSGKTSVLNAMAWILSPSSTQDGLHGAYLLSTLKFSEINIDYVLPGHQKPYRVTAKQSEEAVTIEVNNLPEPLIIPVLNKADFNITRGLRLSDDPSSTMAAYLASQAHNGVLRHLNNLPGPLYLPLNRRWTEERDTLHDRVRYMRPVAPGHLPIVEILTLAEIVFGRERDKTDDLNEDLRNSILTSLFEMESLIVPSQVATVERLTAQRSRVISAMESLGLAKVRETSENYFDRLEEVSRNLGGKTMPENLAGEPEWLDWLFKVGPIAMRIERLIPLIEKYDADFMNVTRHSRAFLESVNSFIGDTNKTLSFRGNKLSISLPDDRYIDASGLSSGELQLLVLFARLYFQFDPEQELAVFVDEPELSLHIAWQNRYIASVREANPNAQFIIATHSPEIAGPNQDAVIDITPRKRLHA